LQRYRNEKLVLGKKSVSLKSEKLKYINNKMVYIQDYTNRFAK